MNMQQNKIKQLNKTALAVAVVQFILSFFTDRFMFRYVFLDFSNAKNIVKSVWAVGVKGIFLLLLVALWQWLFWFVKKADRRFFRITLGYFAVMMVLLLLVWPGIWRMDEFGLLSSSIQLMPHFWQNYITSVFYIFSLMLLPFPAGVIIVQCFCISLIVARLVTLCLASMELSGNGKSRGKSNGKANNRDKWQWLLLVPFFLFPVLDSNLYPLRMSLYAFLEVLLVAELFFFTKRQHKAGEQKTEEQKTEEHKTGQREWSFWCRILILAAVVTVWRTESIYYFLIFPLFLFWMGKAMGNGKRFMSQIIIYLIASVVLFVPQKVGERLDSGRQYELTSVVLPLVPLVEEADARGERELLEIIDKVVNVEVVLEGAKEGRTGISLFWGEADFQREYDSRDFSEFKTAYYKLIMKYPGVFLRERWQTFVDSSDLLENTTELFVNDGVPNYQTFQTYPLTQPISDTVRTSVIKKLELRRSEDYYQKLPFTDIVYSAIPAIIILLVACVILLKQGAWQNLYLLMMILVKVPLVFLTAPSRLFMYYYSVYLFGYCVLFYCITAFCMRRQEKHELL